MGSNLTDILADHRISFLFNPYATFLTFVYLLRLGHIPLATLNAPRQAQSGNAIFVRQVMPTTAPSGGSPEPPATRLGRKRAAGGDSDGESTDTQLITRTGAAKRVRRSAAHDSGPSGARVEDPLGAASSARINRRQSDDLGLRRSSRRKQPES